MRWALWISRSRMASATVGSPISSCQRFGRELTGDQGGAGAVAVVEDFQEVAVLGMVNDNYKRESTTITFPHG